MPSERSGKLIGPVRDGERVIRDRTTASSIARCKRPLANDSTSRTARVRQLHPASVVPVGIWAAATDLVALRVVSRLITYLLRAPGKQPQTEHTKDEEDETRGRLHHNLFKDIGAELR
jgi:hypothetical protein